MKDVMTALRELSAATPDFDQPAIENRLRAAFAEHRAQRAARVRTTTVWWAAAAALMLTCGGGVGWLASSRHGASVAQQPAALVLDFVALPGAAALPDFERGDIVRIEVPVASLPAYGFDIVPDAAPAVVPADLLVGQDGVPRAIRIASERFQ